MYLRPAFAVTDLDRIAGLIAAHPFGVLVTGDEGTMAASHIPFVVTREGDDLVLTGHLGRANAQCAQIAGGRALAIFSGPHAYIAPGWYATQPAVPTWDYAAVHVHGVLEPVEEAAPMRAMMRDLAAHDPLGFEFDTLDPGYREGMMRGVCGFRLVGQRIEAQWKMSQNRSAADRAGVVAGLRAQGSHDVADIIQGTLAPQD